MAGAQLLLDVGDDAVVRRRRRAEHADAVGQALEHVGDAAVVGPEVVTPVGDAVRLVDDEQADPLGEDRQHLGAELRVVQPLGADQQQVDGVGVEQAGDLAPGVAVGRVDSVRTDPEPLRRGDLVAHEGQQGRHDQRGSGVALAQQRRRDEVDGGLAPAGALDAQHAGAVLDEVGDRLELVLAEHRGGAGQLVQELGRACLDVGRGGHLNTLGRGRAKFAPLGWPALAVVGACPGGATVWVGRARRLVAATIAGSQTAGARNP